MKLYGFILMFALSLTALQAESPAPSDETLARLAKVNIFSCGGVKRDPNWIPSVCGPETAPTMTQGQEDLETIMARPTALIDLKKLYQIGNPQAKCYALLGFRKLDPDAFKELTESQIHDQTKIQAAFVNYNTSFMTLGSAVQKIEACHDRIIAPETEENTVKFLQETIISEFSVEDKPIVEILRQIQELGNFSRNRVSIRLFAGKAGAQKKVSLNLKHVPVYDILRVVTSLSGMQMMDRSREIYVIDPSSAIDP